VPVTSGDLQKWLKSRKARLQRWVKSSDFRAAPASHCLVPNADGSLACVLVGIGCEDDPFAVSHLSAVLPAGNYRIAADWPRDRLERAAIGWALGAYQFTRYKKSSPVTKNASR
jgi:leucyl aminopeptidase